MTNDEQYEDVKNQLEELGAIVNDDILMNAPLADAKAFAALFSEYFGS